MCWPSSARTQICPKVSRSYIWIPTGIQLAAAPPSAAALQCCMCRYLRAITVCSSAHFLLCKLCRKSLFRANKLTLKFFKSSSCLVQLQNIYWISTEYPEDIYSSTVQLSPVCGNTSVGPDAWTLTSQVGNLSSVIIIITITHHTPHWLILTVG